MSNLDSAPKMNLKMLMANSSKEEPDHLVAQKETKIPNIFEQEEEDPNEDDLVHKHQDMVFHSPKELNDDDDGGGGSDFNSAKNALFDGPLAAK